MTTNETTHDDSRCAGGGYSSPCDRPALPGTIYCAACDKDDREGRASNMIYTVERCAEKAAKARREADSLDGDAAYGRAMAVALLDGRREPRMAEVALHTLAMHDELVARMAAQREALVYEVERAQRLDTWVASKAVAA